MAAETAVTVCAKPGCKVVETGVCAEGHAPLVSCPYYGNNPIVEAADDELEDQLPSETNLVRLPGGDFLTPEELDEFLRWRPVNLIAVVGDPDSGKTTLTCSIYERYLKGPFAGQRFAGSRTLIGLERRSHESRIESGRSKPDTKRTPISDGLSFAHFALIPTEAKGQRVDLMLSDRAGELYTQARNNSGRVSELIEVKKADVTLLLMDGKRLADPTLRAGAMQGVRQSLRAFLDGGVLGVASVVQVVTTKIDLIDSHVERDLIRHRARAFYENLSRDFGSRVSELTFWEVAARDPNGNVPVAYGMAELVQDWIRPRSLVVEAPRLRNQVTAERDKLLQRIGIEVLP